MVTDITDTTMKVSTQAFQIPRDSDFYRTRQGGHDTIPDCDKKEFIRRFNTVAMQSARNYRHLCTAVHDASVDRGYTLGADWLQNSMSVTLRRLFIDTGNNVHLFSDVLCAALASCPTTVTDIYQ